MISLVAVEWPDDVLRSVCAQLVLPVHQENAGYKFICALRDVHIDRTQKCLEFSNGKGIKALLQHTMEELHELVPSYKVPSWKTHWNYPPAKTNVCIMPNAPVW